ncbi:MAG: RES family NAD+ phosphorylase [Parvularculaceae bacterium]
MKLPRVTRLRWRKTHRIISTRHPPIDLFEDIADPAKWDAIASGESKSNARVAASIGRLELVPAERRVGGIGASYVMAPFVHISPRFQGRFHDGTFGAYYAANRFETAVAETTYHRARFYADTEERPGWFSQFRELVGSIDARIHDIRGDDAFAGSLDPDDYTASQALARELRADGSNGVAYPSVRDPDGQCVAALWPDVISIPVLGRALAYHFDGARIDLIRDETSMEVWRIL